MAYITTVNKQTYRVATGGEGQQSVTLEGVVHAIDWQQVAPLSADNKGVVSKGGRYSLLVEGKSYEIFARRINESRLKE